MTQVVTDILVGSKPDLGAQSLTIDGSAESVAQGSYYLRHSTSSKSLLAQVVAAMTSAGVSSPTATVTTDRKVVLSAGATFTMDFADNELADLLGFTVNLSGSSSYTAPLRSPLLWSAGAPATRRVRRGFDGWKEPGMSIRFSADFTRGEVAKHHTAVRDRLSWSIVDVSRLMVVGDYGGTFRRFLDEVIWVGGLVHVYEDQVEEDGGTDPITWGTPRGPYRALVDPEWYRRAVENADIAGPLDFKVIQQSDYS